MLRTCLFILFAYSPAALLSQNAFLNLYHPFYKSLTALQTDSLFIRTLDPNIGTVERTVYYQYLEDNTIPPDWLEYKKEADGKRLWRTKQHLLWDGNFKVIETETLDSIAKITTRERVTISESNVGQPDSLWYDNWDGLAWQPVQKLRYAYNKAQLLEQRLEWKWDVSLKDWTESLKFSLEYDKGNRPVSKKLEEQSDKGWALEQQYTYAYRSGEELPASTVWRSRVDGQLLPIDSTVVWYDDNGTGDSSIVYFWDAGASIWYQNSRRVWTDSEQKTASEGDLYIPVDNQDQWKKTVEIQFNSGDQLYTNEPREEIVRVFDAASGSWSDKKRKTVVYEPLGDSRVHGVIQVSEWNDNKYGWDDVLFAEAWFHISPQKPALDSLGDRNRQFTFSYACGLPNPYVRNVTLAFPNSEASGAYELKIINEEGRLVYRKQYDDSGIGSIDASLQPGFYLVSVSRGGTPLCTQKLIVQ